jgi:glycosyltransferase involved in cell wall biosynthesis
MKIRKKLGILPDEKVLLFSGRPVKAKGIFELLDAFEIVWKENPKIRLVIAGQVFNLNEYVSHIAESATHVCYTGLVSKERINEWYRAADIGILPSYTEQCSYTALEMMTHKLPMITTDGNGLKDMFIDKKSAVIIPANPDSLTEDLVKAIQQMLKSSKRQREELANRSYMRVSTEFTIANMKKRYVELFTNL